MPQNSIISLRIDDFLNHKLAKPISYVDEFSYQFLQIFFICDLDLSGTNRDSGKAVYNFRLTCNTISNINEIMVM